MVLSVDSRRGRGEDAPLRRDAVYSGFDVQPDPSPERQALIRDAHTVWLAALDGHVTDEQTTFVKGLVREAAQQDLSPNDVEHLFRSLSAYTQSALREGTPIDWRDLAEETVVLRQRLEGTGESVPVEPFAEQKFQPTQKTIKDVKDFFAFAETDTLRTRETQGFSLEDAIYQDFYSEDASGGRFQESDPSFAHIREVYAARTKELDAWVEQMTSWLKQSGGSQALEAVEGQREKGWTYLRGNGGLNEQDGIGRFYLNIKPEVLQGLFAQCVDQLREQGVGFDAKIPLAATAEDFNRPDKMVLYFNEKDQARVLATLTALHQAHVSHFESATPRFTASLKNERNEEMQGIAFGEQPIDHGKSFGGVRSEILASLLSEARRQNIDMRDPDFYFSERFQQACRERGVDPENTAFNTSSGTDKPFGAIREKSV